MRHSVLCRDNRGRSQPESPCARSWRLSDCWRKLVQRAECFGRGLIMSTITRRNLLQLGAIAAAASNAVWLSATPKNRMPGPATQGWETRSTRWIQVAFTEDD